MAWTEGDDAVGVPVLLSPVASPRAQACSSEREFYYTLVFPNTRVLSARSSRRRSHEQHQQRVSYQDAVALLRAVTSGGKEREKRAIDELRCAWMRKFRASWPAPHDTVPFVYLQELLREVIVQRFDAIPGLFVAAHVSADEELLLLSFRPSKALLAAKAEALQLRVPVAPALDPGEAYWRADPRRSVRESSQWGKAEAQEELYRLFLAGKIPADEAQLFDGEDAAMWSRRIHALQRFADPQAAAAAFTGAVVPRSLPYKSRAALQYLYRSVETSTSDDSSPFRVVDKIRLTKAIIDAEFDCDALVAQHVLTHHFCTHTHHTDAVDTSIDVLRVQWGSLLSPWRLYRQRLAPLTQLLHFQPIAHVRNYFGEEIALCTCLCGCVLETVSGAHVAVVRCSRLCVRLVLRAGAAVPLRRGAAARTRGARVASAQYEDCGERRPQARDRNVLRARRLSRQLRVRASVCAQVGDAAARARERLGRRGVQERAAHAAAVPR